MSEKLELVDGRTRECLGTWDAAEGALEAAVEFARRHPEAAGDIEVWERDARGVVIWYWEGLDEIRKGMGKRMRK